MSDEPQRTYTAREIVLEFFPATSERLVPRGSRFRLERLPDGSLTIRQQDSERSLVLSPVERAGNGATQLCCDVCGTSAPRRLLQMYRMSVPGSDGRRFRYLSICFDLERCNAGRLGDGPLHDLVRGAFES